MGKTCQVYGKRNFYSTLVFYVWEKMIMPKVAIVTDSTVDLPEELAQQYNMQIAPQQII